MSKKTNSTESTKGAASALPAMAAHVRKVPADIEAQIDEALGLQAISIRLQKNTIDTYKMLAKMHGVGYQPLMRDALCRWAESELKQLLIGAVESQRQETAKVSAAKTRENTEVAPPAPMKRAA